MAGNKGGEPARLTAWAKAGLVLMGLGLGITVASTIATAVGPDVDLAWAAVSSNMVWIGCAMLWWSRR